MMWLGLAILAVGAIILLLKGGSGGDVFGLSDDAFVGVVTSVALLVLIGLPLLRSYRGRFGEAARHAAIWLAIALALLVGYTYRSEMTLVAQRVLGEVVPGMSATMVETGPDGDDRRVVVIRADSTGHFTVRATINGHTLLMLVDTGATAITLSYEDAERIGIDVGNLHFSLSVHTANGIANAAEVRLRSLSVGEIEVKGLRALVTQPGAMRGSLLGMNFLRSLGSYEVRGDRMYLRG